MDKMKFEIPEKTKLWSFIVAEGRKIEPRCEGIANKFNADDIKTIIGTMEFFGATDIWLNKTIYDLRVPKYRLFDWLAMCVMSRNNDDRTQNEQALKVLVYSWFKVGGLPADFIEDLRVTDYEINTNWEEVEIPS